MAISRDTYLTPVTVSSGNITQAYTNAGDLLVVYVYEEATNAITSVTFNSAALTKVNDGHMCYTAGSTTHTGSWWYLVNPTVGTANIVVTRSSGTSHMEMTAASYIGAGAPDVFNFYSPSAPGTCATATSVSTSITTVADNAWVVSASRFDNGGTVSGTGSITKLAQGASGEASITAIYDSNAALTPAGSKTIGSSGANSGSAWILASISIPPANTAIAYDATSTGTYTTTSPLAWSHTCTGSQRILFVSISTPTDAVTGVTYAGVSMTLVGKSSYPGSGRNGASLWYLINPASGANNISATFTGASASGGGVSYTGAKQSGQPDSSNTKNQGSAENIGSISTTVVAADCWMVVGLTDDQGSGATGSGGSAVRNSTAQGSIMVDSNSIVGTGSQTVSWDFSGSNAVYGAVAASFSPYVTPANLANLKSFDGNLKENIKSINGNVLANIKSLSGNS